VTVRVYGPEKTVADCFRFRNKVGLTVAIEALRLCRERKHASVRVLLEFARIDRVERVMMPYLEAVQCTGRLGERTRLSMQVDVGFGDPVVPYPEDIVFPVLLDFDPPRLLGYTPDTTVAEKFQAMVELDMANSRMKDFYDLWKLSEYRGFDGATLARALDATFSNRRTPMPKAVPTALGPAFSADVGKLIQWRAFLRKGRLESTSLPEVTAAIARLVMPVSKAVAQGLPFAGTWVPGTGWTPPDVRLH
jgi:hypothetical protein